ncbi:MAG: 50S ribosomal protein L29 [Candidatus Harrisonbacteria bacterium]|nr:50S ribosomal protein L29 [Candidatus Harrisonbacteria bacterium]
MRKNDLNSLRGENSGELLKDLQSSKDALWQLKTDLAAGKVKNVREIRKFKEKVAIINTILKEAKLNKQ